MVPVTWRRDILVEVCVCPRSAVRVATTEAATVSGAGNRNLGFEGFRGHARHPATPFLEHIRFKDLEGAIVLHVFFEI